MAITVGTNSYLSVADADTYWLARANNDWLEASTPAKEKALIEATQYIDGAYNFIGTQKTDNVLCWPRFDVYIRTGNMAGVSYDSDTIPLQVKNACAELALDALSERLVETQDRGGAIKREKVDVIEVEYLDFAPSGKVFKFASMILKPLTTGSGMQKDLVRA